MPSLPEGRQAEKRAGDLPYGFKSRLTHFFKYAIKDTLRAYLKLTFELTTYIDLPLLGPFFVLLMLFNCSSKFFDSFLICSSCGMFCFKLSYCCFKALR